MSERSSFLDGVIILRGLAADMTRTDRAMLIVAMLATAFATAALFMIPVLVIQHVIDLNSISYAARMDTLLMFAVIYAVAVTLAAVVEAQRGAVLAAASQRMMRRLYLALLVGAIRFGRAGQPERAATAIQDYAELQRFLASGALLDLIDLMIVPFIVALLYVLHPVYALLFVGFTIVETAFAFYTDRRVRPIVRRAAELQVQTRHALSRRLARQDEVEGLGLLRGVLRQWQPDYVLSLAVGESAGQRSQAAGAITLVLNTLSSMSTVVAGTMLVIAGRAAMGSIIAAMMAERRAGGPLQTIVGNLKQWNLASLAMQRLTTSLTAADQPLPSAPPLAGEPVPGLVVRGLAVTAPNRTDPLIDRLELDVPPGTLLIVTGANGVGKSTLLRTLIGLRPPAGGQVLLDGQDLHRTPRHEVGPRIGFLGQRAQLLDASVMANISRFTGRGAEAVEAARLVGAHEMIGRLAQGYNAPAGPASGLSGGQQRLIALARACFGTPRLVVLDEPEAGLDPNAVGALHRAAAELRQRGCVVVVVTHAAKGWNEIADQELRLAQDGRWACGWLREPSVTGA